MEFANDRFTEPAMDQPQLQSPQQATDEQSEIDAEIRAHDEALRDAVAAGYSPDSRVQQGLLLDHQARLQRIREQYQGSSLWNRLKIYLSQPQRLSPENPNQRDPKKDALAIRLEIFKHAATVSSAIAAIYTTFLLTGLKEKPDAFLALIISIISFFAVVGSSVFTLSNTAVHIHKGNYELTGQVKLSLLATYVFLIGVFASTLIFTFFNISRYIKSLKKFQQRLRRM
jgi:hypothetical protein